MIPVCCNVVADNINLGRIIILDSVLQVDVDTNCLLTDGGGDEGDGNGHEDDHVGVHDDGLAVVVIVVVKVSFC